MHTPGLVRLLTVFVEERQSGLFVATSRDEPDFYLSATTRDRLYALMPAALEDMFEPRGEPSVVLPADDHAEGVPYARIPKQLLSDRVQELC